MSASQDKKRRQAEREAGTSPKTLAQREAEQKARKERRTWTTVGVIVALFIVVILVLNSSLLYTGTTALTIGDYKFTNAEYQYYYNTAYNGFTNQYSSYLSLFQFDTDTPAEDQPFTESSASMLGMLGQSVPESMSGDNLSEDATWADYFKAVAMDNMVQITALWDAAVKEGYTLSEEDSAEIDETISAFETMASLNNLRGADGYCAVVYGKGVDAGLVRELLGRAYIAEAYSTDVFEGFEYSREELDSYYDENADDFDAFTFDYYRVSAEKVEVTETVTDEETGEESEETTEEVTDETMAEAEETANAIAEAVEGGADFAETVSAEVEDAEITEYESVFGYSVGSNFIEGVSDWVRDDARAEGDVAVIESEGTGYYVLLFHSRDDNTGYNGVAFRHILINVADADEDGEISEEERQAAEDEINEIYDQWVEDGETEESFISLANTNSEDSGSNGSSVYSSEGGLYEHVARHQMVPEIDEWIFDSARQPGDSTIVYVEAANYTGYHLVYFVGTDEMSYHDCLAEYGIGSYEDAPTGLRQPDYDEFEAELVAQFPVSFNKFVNWFAKV